jgi:hypothetical protein
MASRVPSLVASFGQRIFVVTGSMERSATLVDGLVVLGLFVVLFKVSGEVDVKDMLMATRNSRETDSQVVWKLSAQEPDLR